MDLFLFLAIYIESDLIRIYLLVVPLYRGVCHMIECGLVWILCSFWMRGCLVVFLCIAAGIPVE